MDGYKTSLPQFTSIRFFLINKEFILAAKWYRKRIRRRSSSCGESHFRKQCYCQNITLGAQGFFTRNKGRGC